MSAAVNAPEQVMMRRLALLLAGIALTVLSIRSVFAGLDFLDAVHYPFEIDYGKGIVWQQAVLFDTARMYAPVESFPFIVFHYPPVYYALVWAVGPWFSDLLAAGRAVSVFATFAAAALIAGCVWVGSGRGWLLWRAAIAGCAGMTALCSANFWTWGLLMRVDMVAIALSFGGLFVAHQARAQTGPLLVALVLCATAVFTKQLQFSAGCAVCVLALIQRPKPAMLCMASVFALSLAAFAIMQVTTHGGLYQHVAEFNVNPVSWRYFLWVLSIEWRDGLILGAGLVAFVLLLRSLGRFETLRHRVQTDPLIASRFLAMTHYAISACTLLAVLKEGSNANYFIEFLASGCVLIGLASFELVRHLEWRWLSYQLAVLIIAPLLSPFRTMPSYAAAHNNVVQWALVELIRQSPTPVSS